MSYIFNLLAALFMCVAIATPAIAGSRSTNNTLDQYVNQVCKKNCTDSVSLLKAVRDTAKRLDLDYKLLLAIIRVESSFQPKARNGSSVGLTQVHLRFHRSKFMTKNYFQTSDNISVGGTIFKDCLTRQKGVTTKALRCYNGGGDKLYAKKVNKAYGEVKSLFIADGTHSKVPDDPLGELIALLEPE